MNKEQLEEALKVVREPITVNSIEYKYFDKENYNKLVNAIDYCNYLNANIKPYIEAQDREIERLNNIIENLDKMFGYYFLGNLKYDQDTVNTIYIKYVKLKELKGEINE